MVIGDWKDEKGNIIKVLGRRNIEVLYLDCKEMFIDIYCYLEYVFERVRYDGIF